MEIIRISSEDELRNFAGDLLSALSELKSGSITVALPGGRSVRPVLEAIGRLDGEILRRLHFYLIDERIDSDRNSRMIRRELLDRLIGEGKIGEDQIRFPEFSGDPMQDCRAYEARLENLDIIIAGSGEDGHFASLFPGGGINDSENAVEYVADSPKPPARRITMTYKAFELYGNSAVYLALFLGKPKEDAYRSFLAGGHIDSLPINYLKRFERLFVLSDLDGDGDQLNAGSGK